jgi:hypothetical protein
MLGTAHVPAVADPLGGQNFSGYSTGTQVSTNALQVGATQVANVQEAFAGASANSQGLDAAITNEMGQAVQPAQPGKNSYGRGTGLEVGLLTNFPDADSLNQLLLSGLAQAAAPPSEGPVTKQIAVDLPPVVYAGLLAGTAQATYDPNFCAVGKPLGYGKGEAANVQVLPTGAGGPGGLVNTGQNPADNTAKTRSFEYLTPNGDGTFALVSETHQTLVPIGIGSPVLGISPLSIEVDGDFIMRVTASGKPGRPAVGPLNSGASVEFSDPLVTVKAAGVPVIGPITLSALLGAGINLNVPLVADISVGGPPRSIGSDGAPTPAVIAGDGTSVDAAYDLLQLAVLTIPGLNGLDLRVGHMEGKVNVPAGGIKCDIPISKTASANPVVAGNDVTISINIPRDVNQFNDLFGCDLVNIRATSTENVLDGNVKYEIVSADHGGVITDNVITWDNVGNYHPGDPPIVLSFVLRIPASSGVGTLEDVANVSASLGNCTGGVAGQDLIGNATLDGGAINGSFTLTGPEVSHGNLAATGEDTKYLVVGGLMLGAAVIALGARRRLRTEAPSNPS